MKEKTLFMMPWFPRDFASSTRGWPLVARAVYRELLDAQWDMGSLPIPPRDLKRISNASESEWRKAWRFVEPKFPVAQDLRGNQTDFRLNLKLESHRIESLALYNKRKAASDLANQARWGNHPNRMPNGSHQSQSQSQSQSKNPKNPEPLKSGLARERGNGLRPVSDAFAILGLKPIDTGPTEEIPF